ncbi:MAG: polysaccharide deacetylase family protein [Bacteroidales bacterium]|nr:polysaccharide deacetylase family protein [Bacteroidales bacterium]
MIRVYIGRGFRYEKEYVIDVLLHEFLGLDYEIIEADSHEYRIVLENENEVCFSDAFFSRLDENESYFLRENIPEQIKISSNQFTHSENLFILFGDDQFIQKANYIKAGLDIFASSFFMLTRWEEIANPVRDEHGRFPDEANLAIKLGFAHRPVVNEYLEFLWNLMHEMGIKQERKKLSFIPYITHDIDDLHKFDSFGKFAREAGKDIIRRKSLKSLKQTLFDYIGIRAGRKKDNFHSFDFFMNISEKYGQKSYFYFIPGHRHEEDVRYSIDDPVLPPVLEEISRRGHTVGLHASYCSYNSREDFREELKRLREIFPGISEGRQHYLRFQNPLTWQLWEENELEIDSTLGFTNTCGFRSGVCLTYPVFDVVYRKRLNLYERPVTVMEVALRKMYPGLSEFESGFLDVLKVVMKYRGEFVLIWHNSSLNHYDWNNEWTELYDKLIGMTTDTKL